MSFICMRMKNDFISKAEHLPSFWNRGPGILRNGLFKWLSWWGSSAPTARSGAPWVKKFGYLYLHPRNFGCGKIVRTFVCPPLHASGCEMAHCWELLPPFAQMVQVWLISNFAQQLPATTGVYVVVQFYSLFESHYHILPYPKTKQRKIKI